MEKIPDGYCQCGCGEKTNIAKRSRSDRGWIKGNPLRYCSGHANRQRGSKHPGWKGGRRPRSSGYVLIWNPYHPKANCNGYVQEHILIAEQVLGEILPDNAIVHHVNGIKSDNRKENLVICESWKYHMMIHQRERALKSCGHADWIKCRYCGGYDSKENLHIPPSMGIIYHHKCRNEYRRNRYQKVGAK